MAPSLNRVNKYKKAPVKPGEVGGIVSFKLAQFWLQQVDAHDQAYKNWYRRGNTVIRRFRDERSAYEEGMQRRMNILWANYKILKPALYGKRPIPNVDRMFLDRDPVARLSSQILERTLRSETERNGLHQNISRAVSDYLLPGRGQVWVRYEPEIGQGPSFPTEAVPSAIEDEIEKIYEDHGKGNQEDEKTEKLEETGTKLISESTPVDYIDWKDFYMFPPTARVWEEVQAVGKRIYTSKEECYERFDEDVVDNLQPETTTPNSNPGGRFSPADVSVFKELNDRDIVIFEIWNKTDGRVYWVSPGYSYLCDVMDDPLELDRFYPCPEPISATLTNDSLIPVPDYVEYQDQAIQIDELTQRIAMLSKACKVAGTYDGANGALKRLLNEGVENQLLPVDSWVAHAEKGGVKGSISFLPIEEIQKVIDTLIKVRQTAMQDLDLITGVNDVLRGTSDSRETLGGLRLKNNSAGTRLSDRQNEVARFARDVIRIMAEIIAKHYSDETLIKMSGILFEDELQPEFVQKEMQEILEQNQPAQPPAPTPQQPQPGPENNVIPFPQPQPGGIPPAPAPMLGPPPEPIAPQLPPPDEVIALKVQSAIDMLRDEVTRAYRIDIETDSTLYGDHMQERDDAVKFIEAVTSYMEKSALILQQVPEATSLFGRMLQFGVRRFRSGRDLESSIDEFVRKLDAKTRKIEKEGPPPDPEHQKMQLDMEQQQQQMAHEKDLADRELRNQEMNDQRDAEKQAMEDQREQQKMAMESQLAEREMAMKLQEMEMKMQMEREKHALEIRKLQMESQHQQVEHQMKSQELQDKHTLAIKQTELQSKQHEQTMEQNDQQHKQKLEQGEASHKQKLQQNKQAAAQKAKQKPKPKSKAA